MIGPILIETAHYIATGPFEAIGLVLRVGRTRLLPRGPSLFEMSSIDAEIYLKFEIQYGNTKF